MNSYAARHVVGVTVVFLAIGVLSVVPAEAATVTGTFRYTDSVSAACPKPSSGGCVPLQPIAHGAVLILHRGIYPWNFWVNVGWTTTDGDGRFTFRDNRTDGTYGVRVHAANYAVQVMPAYGVAFSAEPGHPGPNVNHTLRSDIQEVDFSFDFTDGAAPAYFNVAETVRRGFDYASARRSPNDGDPLSSASVLLTDSTGTPANASWYNPLAHTVVLNGYNAFQDYLILHEYAHWLEAQLSSFAWIPSTHDGCRALNAYGNVDNTPEHAWMEGFADYFAQSVPRFLPSGTFGGWQHVLEYPGGCSASSADAIEDRVAASLWDLFDAANEPHDFVAGLDAAAFQIFDRELDVFGKWPTIWDFRNAWIGRGLDVAGLDRILSHHEILTLPNQAADYVTQSVPNSMIAGQSYDVSVTMRNTGVTTWSPETLHALGSQSAQDNTTWGPHRVYLPAAVRPGGYVTFTFTVRAPSTTGNYRFQWQMVQDGVEWVGNLTPHTVIDVVTSTPPPADDPGDSDRFCYDPVRRKVVLCGW